MVNLQADLKRSSVILPAAGSTATTAAALAAARHRRRHSMGPAQTRPRVSKTPVFSASSGSANGHGGFFGDGFDDRSNGRTTASGGFSGHEDLDGVKYGGFGRSESNSAFTSAAERQRSWKDDQSGWGNASGAHAHVGVHTRGRSVGPGLDVSEPGQGGAWDSAARGGGGEAQVGGERGLVSAGSSSNSLAGQAGQAGQEVGGDGKLDSAAIAANAPTEWKKVQEKIVACQVSLGRLGHLITSEGVLPQNFNWSRGGRLRSLICSRSRSHSTSTLASTRRRPPPPTLGYE